MSFELFMGLAFLFAAISVVIVAFWTGRAYYGGIPMRLLYFEKARQPVLFWLVVVFVIALAAMAADSVVATINLR